MKSNLRKNKLRAKQMIKGGIIFLIPFLIAYFCSRYLVQTTMVQGDSMNPTYHNGQILLINKMDKNLARGDVIVFRFDKIKSFLMKRIIGIPGDEISFSENAIYVNGVPYWERDESDQGEEGELVTCQVPEGHYFVLGDNVTVSVDSRNPDIGCVSADLIIGKIWKP